MVYGGLRASECQVTSAFNRYSYSSLQIQDHTAKEKKGKMKIIRSLRIQLPVNF